MTHFRPFNAAISFPEFCRPFTLANRVPGIAISDDQTPAVGRAYVAVLAAVLHHQEMGQLRISLTVALLCNLAVGCASPAPLSPFTVVVRGPATSCSIEVEGRKVTTDELLEIARPKAKSGRHVRIDSDMAQTPYRCLGGAIFTLQQAEFKDVGFAAKTPSQP